MANPEHIEIAKRGAAAIAEWRGRHPGERFDLSGADLRGADLSGADLLEATLRRANLAGANLTGANLHNANLVRADIREVDFAEANLSLSDLGGADATEASFEAALLYLTNLQHCRLRHAEFSQANISATTLTGADLRESEFFRTAFNQAQLRGANLSEALSGNSIFAACDFTDTVGLQTVNHVWPSDVGIDTLALTLEGAGGEFTAEQRAFFENAGVPRTLLDYLPGLLETHPTQFFSCFISYGTQDEHFADRLYRDLKARGVRCWKYDEDALVGRGVWANIDQAIRGHRKTIAICSQSSLQRPAVQREIERSLQREDELISRQAAQPDAKIDTDVLFPVRLDDYVFEGWEHPRKPDVVAKNIGDFRGWDKDDADYQRGLERLLRALDPRSKLGLSQPGSVAGPD